MHCNEIPRPASADQSLFCRKRWPSLGDAFLSSSSFWCGFISGSLVVYLAFLLNSILAGETQRANGILFSKSNYGVNDGDLGKQSTIPVLLPAFATGSVDTLEADIVADQNLHVEVVGTGFEDWELEQMEVQWGQLENYQLLQMLGEGSYAEAFLSFDLRNNQSCVAKMLKPVSKRKVMREIRILQELAGGPNILTLMDVAKDRLNESRAIVTEYINNTYYRELYPMLNDTEIRFYMFQLLRGLEYAHSKHIFHRDVKPHNVMIDHEKQKLRVIDWGLSDLYDDNYSYSTGVGSRFWRAPELLVGYKDYHLAVDIWAFGCMLAALLFEKDPFFRGRYNDVNQLMKIAKVLGTEDLFKWLAKYEIELDEEFDDAGGWYPKKSWRSFVDLHNQGRVSEDAFDLLSKLLVYDHNERLTATEAIAHAYFDPVRENALAHPSSITV